jgi:hypothetical protein
VHTYYDKNCHPNIQNLKINFEKYKKISLKYKFILPQLNKSLNACHIEKGYKIIKQKKYQIRGSTNPN